MSPDLPSRQYPDILLELVVPYAHNPIPAALSAPPRADLRQSSLCALARTCKRVQALCIPLLYKHVVTDCLPEFLAGVNIPSRRHLYNRVKSLRVEYCPKSSDPTYTGLLNDGTWWSRYGVLGGMTYWVEWEDEIAAMAECLKWVEQPGRVKAVFPLLTTMAVASIYASDGPSRWKTLDMRLGFITHLGGNTTIVKMRSCFTRFDTFLRSSHIKHLCIRDNCGPLNLRLCTEPSLPLPLPLIPTVHFEHDFDKLDLPYDSPVRWVSDITSAEIWHNVSNKLMSIIVQAGQFRKRQMSRPGARQPKPTKVIIYCTTGVHVPVPEDKFHLPAEMPPGETKRYPKTVLRLPEQRYMAEGMGPQAQAGMRMGTGLDDEVKWYASPDTPVCVSCGSGPPVQYW